MTASKSSLGAVKMADMDASAWKWSENCVLSGGMTFSVEVLEVFQMDVLGKWEILLKTDSVFFYDFRNHRLSRVRAVACTTIEGSLWSLPLVDLLFEGFFMSGYQIEDGGLANLPCVWLSAETTRTS